MLCALDISNYEGVIIFIQWISTGFSGFQTSFSRLRAGFGGLWAGFIRFAWISMGLSQVSSIRLMFWRKAAFVHFQATRGVGKSKAIEVSQENIPCPPCGKGRESTKLFDLDCPRWYIPIGVFSLQSRFLGLFHLQIGIFLKFWVGGFEEFA